VTDKQRFINSLRVTFQKDQERKARASSGPVRAVS